MANRYRKSVASRWPPIRKVLIANRGEIAVRIIRACRDMGFTSVAVYSEADRAALHVRLADQAYLLGAAPLVESYLNISRLLEVADKSGADAVHPGYGFLAENALFAIACLEAGLTWIGPNPEAMKRMGSKTEARRTLEAIGIPVVPGTTVPLQSLEEACRTAVDIGYPLMLKASAGGGGKGMRIVHHPSDMPGAFSTARAEALNAFGDDSVYLEKRVVNPRHVEIQIFGDQYGRAVHLGERDCSIQRRHQKVIEETPSPVLDPETRARMGETAVAAAKKAGYDNAGTVEFLVDADRNFYFLEMNTRLQVEHPITEMVTGLDLVKLQFEIAAGAPLPFRQRDIVPRGAAIECRIYAEDPEENFFPCPGRIRQLVEPAGPGIRVDSGVYQGSEVPIYYDSLVAKLIAWGATRDQALSRMSRALEEYRLVGIRSTIGLFRKILREPDFLAGQYDTSYLDARLAALIGSNGSEERNRPLAAMVLAEFLAGKSAAPANEASTSAGPWKLQARREALRET
jgi:acetyl-CoA carboxylase, biotin carboxylase subunit